MKANLYEPSRFQLNTATGPLFCTYEEQHKLHKKPLSLLGESTDENKVLLFFTGLDCVFSLKIRLVLS